MIEPGKGFFQFISFEGNTIDAGFDVLLARLRFRVLLDATVGSADVGPAAMGPTLGEPAIASFWDHGGENNLAVQEFASGAAEVIDCGCPLTVDNLTCEQFLDQVRISFTPSEAYDEIEIRKTDSGSIDEVIAVLEGDADSFTDPLDTPIAPDTIVYVLTGRRAGVSSVRATCEVVTRRAAPKAVSDFACSGGNLTWTNPNDEYDLVLLYKNGDLAAELPGDTVAYVDTEFSNELTIYTLVGQLVGYRSAEINCLENAPTIFEVGDVQVPLGATRIHVPIYVTSSFPAEGVAILLDVDQSRLRLVPDEQLSIRNSEAPTPEGIVMGIGVDEVPSVGILYSGASPDSPLLQPGLRQRVFDFVFDVIGEFAEGETIPMVLPPDSLAGIGLSVESEWVAADLLIDGRLTFGSPGLDGIANHRAVFERGDGGGAGVAKGLPSDASRNVSLSWENGDDYDAIFVERDGEPIAELDGSATDFRDEDLEAGVFTYKLIGTMNEQSTFPVSSTVATVSPPGRFIRGDVDGTGERDLTDALAVLRFLFLGDLEISCQDSADVDDSGAIDLTDGIVLLQYLFLGSAIIPPPNTTTPWLDPTPDDISCGD